jgi:hypothetical protein
VRHTEVILWLTLVGGCVAFGRSQFQLNSIVPDEVVSGSYFSADTGEIKLVGVCDALSPAVRCWDAEGRIDQSLGDQVSKIFLKKGAGANNSSLELSFYFRKKNRILVFRSPVQALNVGRTAVLGGFFLSSNQYLSDLGPMVDPFSNPRYQYLRIDADRSKKAIPVFARLDCWNRRSVEMPAQVGASGSADEQSISIASIKLADDSSTYAYNPYYQKHWDVLLRIKGDGPDSKFQYVIQAYDDKGVAIRRTDRDGRPLKMPVPGQNINERSQAAASPAAMNQWAQPFRTDLGGRVWTCWVNPKYVSKIVIQTLRNRWIEFQNVPLDPKN